MFLKPRPRSHGGLWGYFAAPSTGKTYILTDEAIDVMKQQIKDTGDHRVFSNFPIITPDGKYVSKVLEKWMIGQVNLNDSYLYIQEIWRWFNCNDYKELDASPQEFHDFWSTLGHHEISVHADSQELARLWKVIREDINDFILIEKVCWPLTDRPIYFRLYHYHDEFDMRQSEFHPEKCWKYERVWFNLYVASSYNTKFFGQSDEPLYKGIDWITYMAEKGLTTYEKPELTMLGKVTNTCHLRLAGYYWYYVLPMIKNWEYRNRIIFKFQLRKNQMVTTLEIGLIGIWKKMKNCLINYETKLKTPDWEKIDWEKIEFWKKKN